MAGKLERLEGFASHFGADFYGLPRNQGKIRLERQANQIAEHLPFGEHKIVPLAAGESLAWKMMPRAVPSRSD